jgi:hypothetical protein
MIYRTEKEIVEFAEQLWEKPFSNFEVEVVERNKNGVKMRVSSQYNPPDLAFEQLMRLADFFGTKAINDDDRFGIEGCETCDYGSSYGFTLTIKPEKQELASGLVSQG